MLSRLIEIFEDERLVEKIRKRLPYLFHLAELESSRAGKIGIEVGSLRETIKTITGKEFGGVKLIWTVDAKKAKEFRGKGDVKHGQQEKVQKKTLQELWEYLRCYLVYSFNDRGMVLEWRGLQRMHC